MDFEVEYNNEGFTDISATQPPQQTTVQESHTSLYDLDMSRGNGSTETSPVSDGSLTTDILNDDSYSRHIELTPSGYSSFLKVISTLSPTFNKLEVINIKNGHLKVITSGYLSCDLSIFFDGAQFDFNIVDINSVKLMRLINGGDRIIITDSESQARYIIASVDDEGKVLSSVVVPKPDLFMIPEVIEPEYGSVIDEISVDADTVSTLMTAAKMLESQYYIIAIDDNERLISITTEDEFYKHMLRPEKQEVSDAAFTRFKLFSPFPVSKSDVQLQLTKDNNGEYFIKTVSDIGVDILYIEKLTKITDLDHFELF